MASGTTGGWIVNTTKQVRCFAVLAFIAMLGLSGCGGGGSVGGSASGGETFNGSRGSTNAFAVGGTVSGLPAASTLTLINNGGDALTVSADGAFTFATTQATDSKFDVTVQSHTPGVACSVSNGSGTMGSAAVTGVSVACGAGTVRVLHAFDGSSGSADGQNPAGGLVVDSTGNFYGTTSGGGANGQGTIFKLTPSGTLSVIYSFTGGAGGANPNAGLVIDSNDILYGTTYNDGATGVACPAGCGTIFKIATAGTGFAVLHSFGTAAPGNTAANDGRNPQAELALDSSGNLYGTTYYGGTLNLDCTSGCGTVFKVSTNGSGYTVLYRFAGGVVDGRYPQAGLVLDASGYLYGTTSEGGFVDVQGTVFKLTTAGSNYALMHSFNGADGQKPLAGLLLDSAGFLYGTVSSGTGSASNGAIFKIAVADNSFSLLYSFVGTDGKGPEAGLIMDSAGNLYGVAKIGGSSACANGCGTIFKVTPSGTASVLYSFGNNEGQNPAATLLLDRGGNLYGATTVGIPISISDAGYGNVFKLD